MFLKRFSKFAHRRGNKLYIKFNDQTEDVFETESESCGDQYYYRDFIEEINSHCIKYSIYCGEASGFLLVSKESKDVIDLGYQYIFSENSHYVLTYDEFSLSGATGTHGDWGGLTIYKSDNGKLVKDYVFYGTRESFISNVKWVNNSRIEADELYYDQNIMNYNRRITFEYKDKWVIIRSGKLKQLKN